MQDPCVRRIVRSEGAHVVFLLRVTLGPLIVRDMSNAKSGFKDTCGVCGGTFAIVAGGIARHGFKRLTSYGTDTAPCLGAHQLPHELSPDAAKRGLEIFELHMARVAARVLIAEAESDGSFEARDAIGKDRRTHAIMVRTCKELRARLTDWKRTELRAAK